MPHVKAGKIKAMGMFSAGLVGTWLTHARTGSTMANPPAVIPPESPSTTRENPHLRA